MTERTIVGPLGKRVMIVSVRKVGREIITGWGVVLVFPHESEESHEKSQKKAETD